MLFRESQIDRVFEMLKKMPHFQGIKEMVIETAPNQTSREKLRRLKQAGVTRVSMGIQSFSDAELKTLVRQHSAKKARKALELLMEEGFPCVNIDVIEEFLTPRPTSAPIGFCSILAVVDFVCIV